MAREKEKELVSLSIKQVQNGSCIEIDFTFFFSKPKRIFIFLFSLKTINKHLKYKTIFKYKSY
jgi:hypothetical protein